MSAIKRWMTYFLAALWAVAIGWLSNASVAEFFILYTLHCILFKMIVTENSP